MGVEVYVAPPDEWLKYTGDEWRAYWDSDPPGLRLGSNRAIKSLVETVRLRLEGGEYGGAFPRFHVLLDEEHGGFTARETPDFLGEMDSVRRALGMLALSEAIIVEFDRDGRAVDYLFAEPDDVDRLRREFRELHPGRPCDTVADLNFWVFEACARVGHMAVGRGRGLIFVKFIHG
ncbi:MAG: hypothetical protein HY719_01810 [Planctomycetes bacterium]|nr:hypothetical protein [Planctomycetota bacterium]